MVRRSVRALAGAALAAVLILGGGAAFAYDDGDPSNDPDDGPPGPATQIQIVGTQSGSNVNGVVQGAPAGPVPYPAAPAFGQNRYAALIRVQDVKNPSLETLAYCVNLLNSTGIGIDYSAADWNTNVANAPYIIYILQHYYPASGLPAAADDPERVRAVQSAIWYFSDGFVLTENTPERAATRALTAAIVQDAINSGGATPPVAPTLSLDPPAGQAPSDTRQDGPFRVTGTATNVVVEEISAGLRLFSDAARTQELVDDSPVAVGQDIWLSDVQSPSSTFTLRSSYDVSLGTLYLADKGPNTYQKIVLAQDFTLPVRTNLVSAVYAANGLTLRKTIEGTGAGRQGEVRVELVCDQPVPRGTATTLTVPAGAAAGTYELVVRGIPVGATCRAEERANGANSAATLESTRVTPASVVIPAEGPSVITVVDRYTAARVLPVTGGAPDVASAALVGMGLVAVGALSLALRRRRRA